MVVASATESILASILHITVQQGNVHSEWTDTDHNKEIFQQMQEAFRNKKERLCFS